MNLIENVREAVRSIKVNLLRTVLTGAIIAIGISSLVGMLTAIDGIKAQIADSFSGLGANSFDLRNKGFSGGRAIQDGKTEKTYPRLTFREVMDFKEKYTSVGIATVFTRVTGSAEIKRDSKKTNPNVRVLGADENYLNIKALTLDFGRNFTSMEIQNGYNVCIIGKELGTTLFESNEDPLNKKITVLGMPYTIIGILEEQGGMGPDQGADRQILIPIENASRLDKRGSLTYSVTGVASGPERIDYEMGQAIG
ncbi:MAG: ABC transporter permease, partial [Algoriphagus sp.]